MHFMTRQKVCDTLKISMPGSYRLFKPTKSGLITNTSVVDLLNKSKRGGMMSVSDLPSDIVDSEGLAATLNCGILSKQILSWVHRRKKKMPPHYCISSHCIRFRVSDFKRWIYA